MTAAANSAEFETPAPQVALDDEAIADEVRIVQSVQTQRAMPILLGGNLLAVIIMSYLDWGVAVSSYAVYFMAAVLLLLLPMARSFIQLRHLPRPQQVSRRRIRLIEIHSLLLGLSWAAAIFLLLSELTPINSVTIGMVTVYLAFGAVAQMPSLPRASMAYCGPMVLAAFAGLYVNTVMEVDILLLIFVAALFSLPRSAWQIWQDVQASVRLGQEKLQAEAEAHERETEAIRSILEAVPFPLVVTRETGAVHASAQARRQFGVAEDAALNLDIADFFIDPGEQAQMADLQNQQGRLEEHEVRLKNAQGEPFWASLSTLPMKYEGQDCWLNAIYVIDDRKKAEKELEEAELATRKQNQALKDAEAKLREILESSPIGIVIASKTDGRRLYTNETLNRMMGIELDPLDNTVANDQSMATWADPESLGKILELIQAGKNLQNIETQRVRPDGSTWWVLLHSQSTVFEGEEAEVIWQVDITERKAAEAEQVRAQKESEEQTRILETVSGQLAKYISPQLYQAIFSGEQRGAIESKRKKLTVFFSDIADFTEITDRLESEELTALLNQYLTEMSKIAQEHGANFDKFIGDAMMFYFGDPETKGAKEDASACVHMALAMQRRVRELQDEWRGLGVERPFEIRIGINTGYCTVGNFGSEDRMDYTIIGSEVNLAARLQSHAEVGGIQLANETYALVADWLAAEQGDAITVKGFANPVTTFRVKGSYDDLADQGRISRHESDSVALTIDHDRLNEADKAAAVHALEDALAQLKE